MTLDLEGVGTSEDASIAEQVKPEEWRFAK